VETGLYVGVQDEAKYSWENRLQELQRLMHAGVSFCVNDESMSQDEADCYAVTGESLPVT